MFLKISGDSVSPGLRTCGIELNHVGNKRDRDLGGKKKPTTKNPKRKYRMSHSTYRYHVGSHICKEYF